MLLPTLDSELRYQSGGVYTLGLSIAGLPIYFFKLVWVILQWFNNILQSPAQQESVCWPHVYNSLKDEESSKELLHEYSVYRVLGILGRPGQDLKPAL